MSRKIWVLGITSLVAILLFGSTTPSRERFARYKTLDAYEVRPGVLMMPTYRVDGQICEIALERLHYRSGTIRLDSELSRQQIDEVFDELVPADERGPRSSRVVGSVVTQSGPSLSTDVDYERVSIHIYGIVAASHKRTKVIENRVAILNWKDRSCN
jgi:hypothetical protein